LPSYMEDEHLPSNDCSNPFACVYQPQILRDSTASNVDAHRPAKRPRFLTPDSFGSDGPEQSRRPLAAGSAQNQPYSFYHQNPASFNLDLPSSFNLERSGTPTASRYALSHPSESSLPPRTTQRSGEGKNESQNQTTNGKRVRPPFNTPRRE